MVHLTPTLKKQDYFGTGIEGCKVELSYSF